LTIEFQLHQLPGDSFIRQTPAMNTPQNSRQVYTSVQIQHKADVTSRK